MNFPCRVVVIDHVSRLQAYLNLPYLGNQGYVYPANDHEILVSCKGFVYKDLHEAAGAVAYYEYSLDAGMGSGPIVNRSYTFEPVGDTCPNRIGPTFVGGNESSVIRDFERMVKWNRR